jgi:hypothetical protein
MFKKGPVEVNFAEGSGSDMPCEIRGIKLDVGLVKPEWEWYSTFSEFVGTDNQKNQYYLCWIFDPIMKFYFMVIKKNSPITSFERDTQIGNFEYDITKERMREKILQYIKQQNTEQESLKEG